MYAHDTSIYNTIIKHHENESYIILQKSWAKKWVVNFNLQKTEPKLLTRKHEENFVNTILYFQTEKIQDVTNRKPHSLQMQLGKHTFQTLLAKQQKG